MEMSLKNIIKCARWKSEKKFAQHYDKKIDEELDICFQ